MSAHQNYLEAPYARAAAQDEAYEMWCEDKGFDPEDDHFDDFEEEMWERAEDAKIERAEARSLDYDDDWLD